MGYFSWCFADKNNKKKLRIGERGYILTPDNQLIREDNYDGYGRFASQDVYALVADWNKDHLKEIIADKNLDDFTRQIAIKFQNDEDVAGFVNSEIANGKALEYLRTDWKRVLGIEIACYDEENKNLPYPIKIVSSRNCRKYEDLPASKKDKNQGV